jgi:hypothetical protein
MYIGMHIYILVFKYECSTLAHRTACRKCFWESLTPALGVSFIEANKNSELAVIVVMYNMWTWGVRSLRGIQWTHEDRDLDLIVHVHIAYAMQSALTWAVARKRLLTHLWILPLSSDSASLNVWNLSSAWENMTLWWQRYVGMAYHFICLHNIHENYWTWILVMSIWMWNI